MLDDLDLRYGPTPTKPVLVMQNANDDVVDPDLTRQLADIWCSHGATVVYSNGTDTSPLLPQLCFIGHGMGAFGSGISAQWFIDRFHGQSLPHDCHVRFS